MEYQRLSQKDLGEDDTNLQPDQKSTEDFIFDRKQDKFINLYSFMLGFYGLYPFACMMSCFDIFISRYPLYKPEFYYIIPGYIVLPLATYFTKWMGKYTYNIQFFASFGPSGIIFTTLLFFLAFFEQRSFFSMMII